jgi:hypothetical protein
MSCGYLEPRRVEPLSELDAPSAPTFRRERADRRLPAIVAEIAMPSSSSTNRGALRSGTPTRRVVATDERRLPTHAPPCTVAPLRSPFRRDESMSSPPAAISSRRDRSSNRALDPFGEYSVP